jgi:hypothetical protein
MCRRKNVKGKRLLIISDSQVTVGCISKGRSSSIGLNKIVRRMAALGLAHKVKFYMRYIRTHRNPADGPSRGKPIGYGSDPPVATTGLWSVLPDFYRKVADG